MIEDLGEDLEEVGEKKEEESEYYYYGEEEESKVK